MYRIVTPWRARTAVITYPSGVAVPPVPPPQRLNPGVQRQVDIFYLDEPQQVSRPTPRYIRPIVPLANGGVQVGSGSNDVPTDTADNPQKFVSVIRNYKAALPVPDAYLRKANVPDADYPYLTDSQQVLWTRPSFVQPFIVTGRNLFSPWKDRDEWALTDDASPPPNLIKRPALPLPKLPVVNRLPDLDVPYLLDLPVWLRAVPRPKAPYTLNQPLSEDPAPQTPNSILQLLGTRHQFVPPTTVTRLTDLDTLYILDLPTVGRGTLARPSINKLIVQQLQAQAAQLDIPYLTDPQFVLQGPAPTPRYINPALNPFAWVDRDIPYLTDVQRVIVSPPKTVVLPPTRQVAAAQLDIPYITDLARLYQASPPRTNVWPQTVRTAYWTRDVDLAGIPLDTPTQLFGRRYVSPKIASLFRLVDLEETAPYILPTSITLQGVVYHITPPAHGMKPSPLTPRLFDLETPFGAEYPTTVYRVTPSGKVRWTLLKSPDLDVPYITDMPAVRSPTGRTIIPPPYLSQTLAPSFVPLDVPYITDREVIYAPIGRNIFIGNPGPLLGLLLYPTTAALAWTDNSGGLATNVILDRSLDSGFTTGLLSRTLATSVTSYLDPGLTLGTTYYYRVRAVFGGLSTGGSNVVAITVVTFSPTQVFNVLGRADPQTVAPGRADVTGTIQGRADTSSNAGGM